MEMKLCFRLGLLFGFLELSRLGLFGIFGLGLLVCKTAWGFWTDGAWGFINVFVCVFGSPLKTLFTKLLGYSIDAAFSLSPLDWTCNWVLNAWPIVFG